MRRELIAKVKLFNLRKLWLNWWLPAIFKQKEQVI